MNPPLLITALVAPLLALTPPALASDTTTAHLPSASAKVAKPSATFRKGVLTVRGTTRSERIRVSWTKGGFVVSVDGTKVPRTKRCKPMTCKRIEIFGLAGDDRIAAGAPGGWFPRLVFDGGKGDDLLIGDYWRAKPYPSVNDVLIGGRGEDTFLPGGGADTLKGGLGADTYEMDGANQRATIVEPDEPEVVDHLAFRNHTSMRVELSTLADGTRKAVAWTTEVLMPDRGIEEITGGAGNDQLHGDNAVDRLHGWSGNDVLSPGGSSGDMLSGDSGGDLYLICGCQPGGSVVLEDSSGGDTVYLPTSQDASFRLDTTDAQDVVPLYELRLGSLDFENVVGGTSNDTFIGNALDNFLAGNAGDDDLSGGAGKDTFLVGGFFGLTFGDWGDDTIQDFAPGIDTVDLEAGLSVKNGLGTATVTIWDGAADVGTVTAANGHLWTVADFT